MDNIFIKRSVLFLHYKKLIVDCYNLAVPFFVTPSSDEFIFFVFLLSCNIKIKGQKYKTMKIRTQKPKGLKRLFIKSYKLFLNILVIILRTFLREIIHEILRYVIEN